MFKNVTKILMLFSAPLLLSGCYINAYPGDYQMPPPPPPPSFSSGTTQPPAPPTPPPPTPPNPSMPGFQSGMTPAQQTLTKSGFHPGIVQPSQPVIPVPPVPSSQQSGFHAGTGAPVANPSNGSHPKKLKKQMQPGELSASSPSGFQAGTSS